MADNVNGDVIPIQVTDGVAPSIATNLKAIATTAREADAAVKQLQASLNLLNGGGVASLSSQLQKNTVATTQLNSATQQIAATITSAAAAHNKLAESQQKVVAVTGEQLSLFEGFAPTVAASTNQLDIFAIQQNNVAIVAKTASQSLMSEVEVNQLLSEELDRGAIFAQKNTTETVKLVAAKQAVTQATSQVAAATVQNSAAAAVSMTSEQRQATLAIELMTARKALTAATKNMADAQSVFANSNGQTISGGQVILQQYKDQQIAAMQKVQAIRTEIAALRQQQAATAGVTEASAKGITAIQATSGAIRVLEGNFGTNVRAAENFIVKILGLGPLMKAIFPVIGAFAMLGVIDILTEHVGRLIEAFHSMDIELRNAQLDAIKAGEQILKIKPDGFFSATNFAKMFREDFSKTTDIDLQNARSVLEQLRWKRDLQVVEDQNLEKNKTGLALQKQKESTAQHEVEYNRDAAKAAGDLAEMYRRAATAQKLLYPAQYLPNGVMIEPPKTTPVITDKKQLEAITTNYKIAADASREFSHEADVAAKKLEGIKLGEGLKANRDELKAARAEAKGFVEELGKLNQQQHVVTPQEKLALVEEQIKRASKANLPALEAEKGTIQQEIERQVRYLDQLTEKWQDQVDNIGLYSDALRVKHAQDKIDLDLTKQSLDVNSDKALKAKDNAKIVIENAVYQRELNRVYEDSNGPLRVYGESLRAINKLEADNAITTNAASIARNQSYLQYQQATQPLAQYAHELENQVDLLGKYSTQLSVATQIQQVQNQLRQQGRTLNIQEEFFLGNFLHNLAQQSQIQQRVNQLYLQNRGEVERLTISYAALLKAKKDQIITEEQFSVESAKVRTEIAEMQIQLHKATGNDLLVATLGSYIKNYQGFSKELTTLFQGTFQTIADGAADSLGRALVYADDLGAALANVGREAAAQLISGLLKIGIQMLITHFLGRSLAAAAVTASVAQGAAVAAAWAPAAAFVSLATFGANAAPATAAIGTTTAFAELLGAFGTAGGFASTAHFANGGLVTGPSGVDRVPVMASDGEFIFRKSAVDAIGINNLIAMNSSNKIQSSVGGSGSKISIQVIHDGSTAVEIKKDSDNRIRVIARQEASRVVESDAPKAVANDLHNPNSTTSKSMSRNFGVKRNR